MVAIILDSSNHADITLLFLTSLVLINYSMLYKQGGTRCTAELCLRSCGKVCVQEHDTVAPNDIISKMTAPITGIFLPHVCTMGGIGKTLSVFLMQSLGFCGVVQGVRG